MWLCVGSYEAELNAEVERLKLGDRSSNSSSMGGADAAAPATASPHTSAAGTSSADAGVRATDTSDLSHTSTAAEGDADGECDDDTGASSSAAAPILIEEVVEKDAVKAVAAKGRGNQFYARQQYAEAIDEYTLAISLCPSGDAADAADRENLAVFYSNRAAAYLMQQRHEETISDCTQSLLLHPSNPKALGRRAKAHEALDQLAEAVDDLKALVALDDRDRDSARALARVEKALADKNEKMKVRTNAYLNATRIKSLQHRCALQSPASAPSLNARLIASRMLRFCVPVSLCRSLWSLSLFLFVCRCVIRRRCSAS